MNQQTIGPVTVKMNGGLNVRNEEHRLAKISFLGGTPNATAKLWGWDETLKKFWEVDTLKGATINEDPNNGDKFQVVGVSQLAKDEAVGFDESDCMVTWDVVVTARCSDCA